VKEYRKKDSKFPKRGGIKGRFPTKLRKLPRESALIRALIRGNGGKKVHKRKIWENLMESSLHQKRRKKRKSRLSLCKMENSQRVKPMAQRSEV